MSRTQIDQLLYELAHLERRADELRKRVRRTLVELRIGVSHSAQLRGEAPVDPDKRSRHPAKFEVLTDAKKKQLSKRPSRRKKTG